MAFIHDFLFGTIHFFKILAGTLDWRFFAILAALFLLAYALPPRYVKPFRSVRFNVWLFVVISVAAALGSFFPLDMDLEKAQAGAARFWVDTFTGWGWEGFVDKKWFAVLMSLTKSATILGDKLGLYDIYHSWWFAALLALMAFDVLVCKLDRFPHLRLGPITPRRKDDPFSENVFRHAKLKAEFVLLGSPADVAQKIRTWFENKKMRVTEDVREKDGVKEFALAGGRHRIQRWGDFTLHVSIVLILIGNLIGAMYGFEEILPIMEGSSYRMENRPYEVTLNDFQIEYYESTGAPSLFASDIVVENDGKVIGKDRIIVNNPLDIDRVRFYQASWGMTEDFRSARVFMMGQVIKLEPRKVTQVEGTPLSIRANLFFPTFDIDEKGRPFTRDYSGNNPALQIDFIRHDELQARVWLLQNRPDVAFQVHQGTVVRAPPPPFHLVDVDPILFSGIQVGYDPGAPIFWTGSIILLIGLSIHFYMHQRRLRINLTPEGGKTRVKVGAWNSRGIPDFEIQFQKWMNEIEAL